MTLAFEIRLLSNPWPDTVPELLDLLTAATRRRAANIEERVADGERGLGQNVLDDKA